MRVGVWGRVTLVTAAVLMTMGSAVAQDAGKLSDQERAKRDAEKVFSFIKFQTVRKDKDKDEKKDEKKVAAAPAAPAAAKPQVVAKADEAPRMRGLEPPASGPATDTKAGGSGAGVPPVGTTLPPVVDPVPTQPAASAAAVPAPANPPEAEPDEPDEVPLKLVNYVAPEMNRHVLDAMGGRDHAVPVRFTVEPNGTVSQADPRPGVQRKLGQAAASAIKQWRFSPLPERRVVDVELMFRAAAD